MASAREPAQRWLLLIHHIPPHPPYFRAKVGRRLARIGAVPIKNAVYILPATEQTQEDFEWLAREIAQEGGDATLCRASLVEGLTDAQVEGLFGAARQADYGELTSEARDLARSLPAKLAPDDERRGEARAHVARLKKRLSELLAIDFFSSPGRESADAAMDALERRLDKDAPRDVEPHARPRLADHQGRTWVTRKNIHVDRIASAWLIARFIDKNPTFKFVPGQGYKARKDELTFDMFEATFTHVGDRCTFEVLLERFDLKDPGLRAIGEIIHDVDVKDGKFERPEAPGIGAVIAALALVRRDDDARLALGTSLFDGLLELYRRKRA
jgi:hypothetical protein